MKHRRLYIDEQTRRIHYYDHYDASLALSELTEEELLELQANPTREYELVDGKPQPYVAPVTLDDQKASASADARRWFTSVVAEFTPSGHPTHTWYTAEGGQRSRIRDGQQIALGILGNEDVPDTSTIPVRVYDADTETVTYALYTAIEYNQVFLELSSHIIEMEVARDTYLAQIEQATTEAELPTIPDLGSLPS